MKAWGIVMKSKILCCVLLAVTVSTGGGLAQSGNADNSRGSLPDGESDRGVAPPPLAESGGMIPLLKIDPETMRSLPLGDPAELERGFGTVSRSADGSETRSGPSPAVLDAIKRAGDPAPNAAPARDEDPLFPDESSRAIVGEDSRIRVIESTTYPFRTFGLLWTERGGCSSSLVGPRTVITAAHCVYSHTDGWVKETLFFAGANGEDNIPYEGYEAEDITIMQGFIDSWNGDYGAVLPWDLAVVTLKEAAGDRLGTLGIRTNEGEDFHAYNVGYPADKPYTTMWADRCDVSGQEASGTQYIHRCDTKPGSSGSPMYSFVRSGVDGNRYVEGVNVAEVDTGDTATNYNIGILITGPYHEWIRALRK